MDNTNHNFDGQTSLQPSGDGLSRQAETNELNKTTKCQASVIEFYGSSSNYCGYCKRDETESDGRRSHDVKAHVLRANDYQEILDRGWRRSGNYCYRPINPTSCCPNYTLSCQALKFKLKRSQRRCIENLNSFLVNGTIRERLELDYSHGFSETVDTSSQTPDNPRSFEILKNSPKARDRRFVASCERKVKLYNLTLIEAIRKTREKNASRQHRFATLEEYLYPKTTILPTTPGPLQTKHTLEIKMHYVESKDSQALRIEENELIQRYQEAVHKESPSEWTMSRFSDFLIRSPIIVEPIQHTNGDGHNNRVTLTENNLTSDFLIVKPPDLPTSYGTYHCVYFLDSKMIAVGVMDILPKCITTVYFFYEPEYGFLNLGIYSALVEISMVRQMHKLYSNPIRLSRLKYYYLGFYVHECKKMHYKTKFSPSHLLCSETNRYVPTEVCLKLLEGKKYSRFYQPEAAVRNYPDHHDEEENERIIYHIPVTTPVTKTSSMKDYFDWLELYFGGEYVRILVRNILLTYVELFGHELVTSITLRLNFIHEVLAERYRRLTNQSSQSKIKSR